MILKKVIATATIIFFTSMIFAENTKIAVINFEANNIPKRTAAKVTDHVRVSLMKYQNLTVIDPFMNISNNRLRRLRINKNNCNDFNCAVKIGKLVKADKVLIGQVDGINYNIEISGKMIDIGKRNIQFKANHTFSYRNNIYTETSAFVNKVTNNLSGINTDYRDDFESTK